MCGSSPSRPAGLYRVLAIVALGGTVISAANAADKAGILGSNGDRLTYLDESNPFQVHRTFPKLTTPQWVGEKGVEAVVVLAIDDMRETERFEDYLRPILGRLKQIDGRAPVSIMSNELDPTDPRLAAWLDEGLSIEAHTLSHPCPLLHDGDFQAALDTYHGNIDLLSRIEGSEPVAFRMPCCDSINSASPRFYAEVFTRPSPEGRTLSIDSSVCQIFTAEDPELPVELTMDTDGRERFRKYLPFPSFTTTIDNYPYPYVIGKTVWEFPCMVPSDWEAQNLQGPNEDKTIEDWKAALDATVIKQGTFTMVFHQWGWIRNDQMVEFIDYVESRYGDRVRFLNFREALDRLNRNLLADVPLRNANGNDNGVRLIDLNLDGYLDVTVGSGETRFTRIWNPEAQTWSEHAFPCALVDPASDASVEETGVRFGILGEEREVVMLVRGDTQAGAWCFSDGDWRAAPELLRGLEVEGEPMFTFSERRDRGVRLRDIDGDGQCELLLGNPQQNRIWRWLEQDETWSPLAYALPEGATLVDSEGRDAGLRFVDINEDGFEDIVYSNETEYAIHLFVPEEFLRFKVGWSREVLRGKRGAGDEVPMIVRGGDSPDNGAWFHSKHLWIQNEDTAHLPDYVERRSFAELLTGFRPEPLAPEAALRSFQLRDGFAIELVAAEPEVEDPIAFDWGPDGSLWVVQMQDYPLGLDGAGQPGGTVKKLSDQDGDGRYETATVFLEGLSFPTGVMPWRNGVLVSVAPEIIYAEDTDGDGHADVRTVLFRGFTEGNQQHLLNGFEYGLDNWIYGANGDSGGEVLSLKTGQRTDIRGRDFRFHPDTGEFEAIEGKTQFGRRRDDWGNWFGNNNPAWGWHYVYPMRYLGRNPFLPIPSTRQYLAQYEDGTRVFYISRPAQRFNDPHVVGHVTAACSPTPYRDEWFGEEFATSLFISDPAYNIVHREILSPAGVSFESRRAEDEAAREFLASTDNWFRPTTLKIGPDGALYVADMYRFVIEHPEWIPEDTQRSLDLRAGSDRGRIYRVFPLGATRRPFVALEGLSTKDLAERLESPNGWTRDTVQRLLVERGDPAAAATLNRMSVESERPQVRLQALATLDGLGELSTDVLLAGLNDADARVRREAVRMAESLMPGSDDSVSEMFSSVFDDLVADPSPAVRMQLAFTLGEWHSPVAAALLAKLAAGDWDVLGIRNAILSSAPAHRTSLQSNLSSLPEPFADALLELGERIDASRDSSGASLPAAMIVTSVPPPNEPRPDFAETAGRFADLADLQGDAVRGAAYFQQLCFICHRFGGSGHAVGPDLDVLRDPSPEFLLQSILDPNASVEEKFFEVQVELHAGGDLIGVVVEETETTVTMRIVGGQESTLLKADIKRMDISGKSLMPQGLDAALSPQAMADLIAYLQSGS